MPTITIHPEHVDGLRELARIEFTSACEALNVAQLRDLLDLEDQIGWDGEEASTWDRPGDVRLADELLDKLVTEAWQVGYERLADIYGQRAQDKAWPSDARDAQLEHEARSMLAFHEHVQGQEVAS